MPYPFKNSTIKLKRTVKLAQVLAKYGFQDLLSKWTQENNGEDVITNYNDNTVYKRIRHAIEDLGPTFC